MTQSKAGKRAATHDRHEGRQFVMRCCHKLERFCTCGPDAVATCPICRGPAATGKHFPDVEECIAAHT